MIKVTITDKGAADKISVKISGELNSEVIEEFNSQISPAFDGAGRGVVIDCCELKFISSAGLRSILQLNKKAKADGGSVTLTGVSPDIRQVLDLVGFANFMKVE